MMNVSIPGYERTRRVFGERLLLKNMATREKSIGIIIPFQYTYLNIGWKMLEMKAISSDDNQEVFMGISLELP